MAKRPRQLKLHRRRAVGWCPHHQHQPFLATTGHTARHRQFHCGGRLGLATCSCASSSRRCAHDCWRLLPLSLSLTFSRRLTPWVCRLASSVPQRGTLFAKAAVPVHLCAPSPLFATCQSVQCSQVPSCAALRLAAFGSDERELGPRHLFWTLFHDRLPSTASSPLLLPPLRLLRPSLQPDHHVNASQLRKCHRRWVDLSLITASASWHVMSLSPIERQSLCCQSRGTSNQCLSLSFSLPLVHSLQLSLSKLLASLTSHSLSFFSSFSDT